jgi:hypothetical protein
MLIFLSLVHGILTFSSFRIALILVDEDVPVTDLEFLMEVRGLLWPPRERAKPYSRTC